MTPPARTGKDSLRVLQVIASLSFGGAERVVYDLARDHTNRGDTVEVAFLSTIAGNPMAPSLQAAGIRTIGVDARHLYDPRAVARLAQLVRGGSFDVIHTHLLYPDVLGRVAGRIAGVPVVSTLHNVLASFAQHRSDRYLAERLTARWLTHRLVAVTEATRRAIVAEWRVPPNRIVTIPNGIDLDRWLDVPERAPDMPPRVTTVGSLTRQKAQHIFLAAGVRLVGDHANLSLRIVGAGPQRAELQAIANTLGLGACTELTGAREDVPDLLAESDVFVLSSAWEGMPLSAMEALAAGRPAVVTDVGGNRDVVDDGVTGFVVPPEDPVALASAIDRLLSDPDLRRRMGREARRIARDRFSNRLMADRYRNLYLDAAIAGRSQPTSFRHTP